MVVKNYIEKNRYYDSVFLMKIASKLAQTEDVDNASIGMGTPLNKETISDLGLDTGEMKNASSASAASSAEKFSLICDRSTKSSGAQVFS